MYNAKLIKTTNRISDFTSDYQTTGRRILIALARGGQTSLDDLTLVAHTFNLKATDVAEAIAARFNPGETLLAVSA